MPNVRPQTVQRALCEAASIYISDLPFPPMVPLEVVVAQWWAVKENLPKWRVCRVNQWDPSIQTWVCWPDPEHWEYVCGCQRSACGPLSSESPACWGKLEHMQWHSLYLSIWKGHTGGYSPPCHRMVRKFPAPKMWQWFFLNKQWALTAPWSRVCNSLANSDLIWLALIRRDTIDLLCINDTVDGNLMETILCHWWK